MTHRLWRLCVAGLLACVTASAASAATVARSKADRVNVRSRPGFVGEIITQLTRGQQVQVIGTNVLAQPAAQEPPVWLIIELPPTASLWVASDYVEAESKRVTADVLNARAGPGIEFATVGRVPHGTQLEPRGGVKEGWIEIAAPPGSHGYVPESWMTFSPSDPALAPVAARTNPASPAVLTAPTDAAAASPSVVTTSTPITLRPPPPDAVITQTLVSPPQTFAALPVTVPEPFTGPSEYAWFEQFVSARAANPPRESAPSDSPLFETESFASPTSPADAQQDGFVVESVPGTDAIESFPERPEGLDQSEGRWVRRGGLVIRPFNFAAPSFYGLQARDSGKTINFLFTTRAEPVPWSEYRGKVVIVTGREYLDRRTFWRGIPLLDVEEIEAVR